MSITANDLKTGKVYKEDGAPLQVIKYEHKKIARGGATIKLKVRNLRSGAITDKTYNSSAKVEEVEVRRRAGQFLYSNPDGSAVFMNPQTYDQYTIDAAIAEEALSFITAGSEVPIIFYENDPITIDLPPNVALKVTMAPPGARGNTAQTALKEVETETGLKVNTPLFIKNGDIIKVDTRSGEYVERANS